MASSDRLIILSVQDKKSSGRDNKSTKRGNNLTAQNNILSGWLIILSGRVIISTDQEIILPVDLSYLGRLIILFSKDKIIWSR